LVEFLAFNSIYLKKNISSDTENVVMVIYKDEIYLTSHNS